MGFPVQKNKKNGTMEEWKLAGRKGWLRQAASFFAVVGDISWKHSKTLQSL